MSLERLGPSHYVSYGRSPIDAVSLLFILAHNEKGAFGRGFDFMKHWRSSILFFYIRIYFAEEFTERYMAACSIPIVYLATHWGYNPKLSLSLLFQLF